MMQEPTTAQQLSPVPTSEVSVFSGQGIASGQLAELRRVVALPLVREFVQDLSCLLSHEVERAVDEKSHRRYLSQGLDIAEWATAKGAGPDMEYLNGPVVPLVLTFVVQLAVFKYCWLRSESPHIQVWASAGHSCGMAAAMVVALSTDAPSFAAHSRRFALLLLHFSLSAATSSCALLDASPATPDASPPNANVSFALAVLKIDVAEVRCQVETFNQSLPGGPSLHTRVDVVVLNGAKACTVVGSPTALSAFEPQLQQLQNVTTRRLPVSLPFHSEWLDDAAAHTIDSNLHENTPASSLVRPLFSCVDGRMLTQDDQQVPSLEAFLIRILATWPVDWPAAVQSIASHASGRSTRFVDYGPGGGSSALRMSSVIAAECGIADIELDYFSQHHCCKGALPQSWLAWLKQPEDESRLVSSAGSSAKVTQSTKKARNFVWFSDRLKIATNSAMKIDFCSRVLDAISLELDKVQAGRDKAMLREYPAHLETHIRSSEYRLLSQETTRSIDTARYPFCAVLCNLLQLEVPLHRLHHLFHGDQGSKRDRRQKTELMQPLRMPAAREQFVQLFETFNLEQLAPLVCDALGCDRFIFQSFPCIRVLRPGEFSIGPHCDAQYNLPEGNLNVYLPLTNIRDTNSLYLESSPGLNDFHPLELDYGQFVTFYGVYCTHFGVENLTEDTRVSLDWRIIPGNCYEADASKHLDDFKVGSYYTECVRHRADGQFEVTCRGFPSHRHGFPHTNK